MQMRTCGVFDFPSRGFCALVRCLVVVQLQVSESGAVGQGPVRGAEILTR